MFKIKYIQGQRIDTTTSISAVIGQAIHRGLEVYYGGDDKYIADTEAEAIEFGMKAITSFIEMYNEGFIEFSKTIETKQKALEKALFGFQAYVKEVGYKEFEQIVSLEEKLERHIRIEHEGNTIDLPIKLKGYTDMILRKENGKLRIIDYKTTSRFSNPDKLDGAKMIQAIQYYFLVFAEYGEAPEDFVFREIKTSPNRDKSSQVREYIINYKDHSIMFDFYLRLYWDVIASLQGEAVYVPNIFTQFENEVSLISYIHKLDVPEIVEQEIEIEQVSKITDLLEKKLSRMKMYADFKEIEQKLKKVKNMDYSKMSNEEKIVNKLMEFAIPVKFEKKIESFAVDIYLLSVSMGVSVKSVMAREEDLSLVLGVDNIRISRLGNFLAVEIPKEERRFPEAKEIDKTGNMIAVGVDMENNIIYKDYTEFPHILVAGSTGSGKSVFLDSTIKQLVGRAKFILIDPKGTELNWVDDPVRYTDKAEEVPYILSEVVNTMENRFKELKEQGKKKVDDDFTDRLVVVIDEYSDVVNQNKGLGAEIQRMVLLLAQKARAVGIHLILATQRPDTKIIDGNIKANFPVKAVFRLPKAVDSKVVIDEAGAEKLLGKGDMLFQDNTGKIIRLQGLNL